MYAVGGSGGGCDGDGGVVGCVVVGLLQGSAAGRDGRVGGGSCGVSCASLSVC